MHVSHALTALQRRLLQSKGHPQPRPRANCRRVAAPAAGAGLGCPCRPCLAVSTRMGRLKQDAGLLKKVTGGLIGGLTSRHATSTRQGREQAGMPSISCPPFCIPACACVPPRAPQGIPFRPQLPIPPASPRPARMQAEHLCSWCRRPVGSITPSPSPSVERQRRLGRRQSQKEGQKAWLEKMSMPLIRCHEIWGARVEEKEKQTQAGRGMRGGGGCSMFQALAAGRRRRSHPFSALVRSCLPGSLPANTLTRSHVSPVCQSGSPGLNSP